MTDIEILARYYRCALNHKFDGCSYVYCDCFDCIKRGLKNKKLAEDTIRYLNETRRTNNDRARRAKAD